MGEAAQPVLRTRLELPQTLCYYNIIIVGHKSLSKIFKN
jgi:hypothetical protein